MLRLDDHPPMNITYYDYCRASSQKLADCFAISADLNEALRYIGIARGFQDPYGPNDVQIKKSLLNSALVSYARALGGGGRINVGPEFAELLTPNEADIHKRLIDTRNQWVAHSVNDLEHHNVRLEVVSDDGAPRAHWIGVGVSHPIFLSEELVDGMAELARKAMELVFQIEYAERDRALASISEEVLATLRQDPDAFTCGHGAYGRRPRQRAKFKE